MTSNERQLFEAEGMLRLQVEPGTARSPDLPRASIGAAADRERARLCERLLHAARRQPCQLVDSFDPAHVVLRCTTPGDDVLIWEHRPPGGCSIVPPLGDVTVSLMMHESSVRARFRDGRDVTRRARAGELAVVRSSVPFELSFQPESRMLNVSISARMLRWSASQFVEERALRLTLPDTHPRVEDPALRALVEALHSAVAAPISGLKPFVQHTGRAIASHLMCNYGQSYHAGFAPTDMEDVTRVALFLRDLPDGRCSLADLAELARLSPARLLRRFKTVFGESPKQYHMRLRLEAARSALAGGADTVTQVAFDAGFTDLAHFSRVFKRHFGRPPSTFLA